MNSFESHYYDFDNHSCDCDSFKCYLLRGVMTKQDNHSVDDYLQIGTDSTSGNDDNDYLLLHCSLHYCRNLILEKN